PAQPRSSARSAATSRRHRVRGRLERQNLVGLAELATDEDAHKRAEKRVAVELGAGGSRAPAANALHRVRRKRIELAHDGEVDLTAAHAVEQLGVADLIVLKAQALGDHAVERA